MIEEGIVNLGGGGRVREGGKRGVSLPKENFLTVHMDRCVAEARREIQ